MDDFNAIEALNNSSKPTEQTLTRDELFKLHIEPALRQLVGLCSSYDIPMFFVAALSDVDNHTEYVKEIISPQSHQIHLSQDIFSDLIAVTLGFTTVPPVEKISIDYDEDINT